MEGGQPGKMVGGKVAGRQILSDPKFRYPGAETTPFGGGSEPLRALEERHIS
jgi:hypothetical protein